MVIVSTCPPRSGDLNANLWIHGQMRWIPGQREWIQAQTGVD
jgi:hypothetical protein